MNKKERKQFDRTKGMRCPLPKHWRQGPSPKSTNSCHGWVAEMDRGLTDGQYAVLVRTVETEPYGPVLHAAIRNRENTEISWCEKQRIKNELFGEEREAIECFPKESELIDEANMYHLWVFPPGIGLPFGLIEKNVMAEKRGGT
ncbi:DUF7694 domain-containing protein [Enterococcus sp. 5B3_DIV0040]|uniref:DUF7694 domain-containing protein n=1 Tax=Enterococcus sp. 5B3_DIV0040 TaxID=1834182 RepID=UPI000B683485|nr:hypothetical protein [Enterococcus sp. 5B3_DIV0040]OTO02216.1 hypothetical protein A5883_003043 [Enterococcus sp. 5B3_DIV0040]OTO03213.1 hypothetical protein A5883_000178 [Enterococcus sp. 5B3_DIV0040]